MGTLLGGGETQVREAIFVSHSAKDDAVLSSTSATVLCAGAPRDRSMASLKSARSPAEVPDDWFPPLPLRWRRSGACITFIRSMTPRVMLMRANVRLLTV